MIEEISAPGTALGWRFSGKVTSADYTILREGLARVAGSADDRLRVLWVVDDDARWGIDALVADSRLARYTHRIERVAVVGTPSWTSTLVFIADLWPGWSVRHFSPSSRAAAERWLGGESASG
jgi:hypothetical protein